jgi:hypothetical protein
MGNRKVFGSDERLIFRAAFFMAASFFNGSKLSPRYVKNYDPEYKK